MKKKILMPPDYRHGGIKIKCTLLQANMCVFIIFGPLQAVESIVLVPDHCPLIYSKIFLNLYMISIDIIDL